ncbi:MAG TPA: hypothetical protein DCW90_07200 [Lachnospiraceae bacterium]|nr:hypothetical protein [Lachnospiraceae bacterium]
MDIQPKSIIDPDETIDHAYAVHNCIVTHSYGSQLEAEDNPDKFHIYLEDRTKIQFNKLNGSVNTLFDLE